MISNKHLIEEVHKDFEKIFHTMTYRQALFKFRQIHNVLKSSKAKKYNGRGKSDQQLIHKIILRIM